MNAICIYPDFFEKAHALIQNGATSASFPYDHYRVEIVSRNGAILYSIMGQNNSWLASFTERSDRRVEEIDSDNDCDIIIRDRSLIAA